MNVVQSNSQRTLPCRRSLSSIKRADQRQRYIEEILKRIRSGKEQSTDPSQFLSSFFNTVAMMMTLDGSETLNGRATNKTLKRSEQRKGQNTTKTLKEQGTKKALNPSELVSTNVSMLKQEKEVGLI
eukprot:Em0007g5a